jgi:inositol phosphorylceramide mannosyltransferase catalytic subunit
MPEELVGYGRSWERLHPGWEVVTWRDDDLDWLRNRAEFDRAPRYTTKANIARYEIVLRHGGLYVDCDFEALRPFDELLEGASLVVGEERDGALGNALFAATAGHPVLAYAVDELPRSFGARFEDHSIASTGPEFWTRCVRRAGVALDVEPRVLGRDLIYPYGFDPAQRHLRRADFGTAFAVHHWADDRRPAPTPAPAPTATRLWSRSVSTAPRSAGDAVRSQGRRQVEQRVKPWIRGVVCRLLNVPGPWVWGTYVGDNRVVVRTTTGVPMLAFADDLGVTPSLLAYGEYDQRFVRFVHRHLDRGDAAVDVGANIGLFTVEMARAVGQTGRIWAYEPNAEVHALLEDNVYLNRNAGKLGAEVRCRAAAAGSGTGAGTLHVPPRHRGRGSLRADAVADSGALDAIEVAIVDLDTELADVVEVKLVKIDVEGGELDVLRGMRRLLAERRVRLIDLELVDRHAGARWGDLASELRRFADELGGRFHSIDRDGGLAPVALEWALHQDALGHLVVSLPPA